MLTLSATLKAAQQKFDVVPVVSVLVGDVPPEGLRLSELSQVYSGGEGDVSFDASLASTGAVVRARVDGSGNAYAQVATPGNGASFGAWQQLAAGTAYPNGPVAVAAMSDGFIRLWYLAADGHSIMGCFQATAGATTGGFGVPGVSVDAGAGFLVTGLAVDGQDVTARMYFVVSGGQLWERHIGGGGWTAPLGDGGAYTGTPQIAAGYRPVSAPHGDGNSFVVVTYGSPSVLAVRQFNAGAGTWGPVATLRTAGVGSGYSFGRPFLAETRADQARQVLTWVETAPTPLGQSVQVCVTPTHDALPGSIAFGPLAPGVTLSHGLKVLRDEGAPPLWWFLSAAGVWTVPADGTAVGQRVSFAQDQVVELRIDQPAVNRRAEIQVTVLNDAGKLASAGQAGAYRGLRAWSQVALSLGYHTTIGDESAWQVPCWVEAIAFRDDVATGEPLATLFCTDGWGMLDHLVNRTAITFTNSTLDVVLSWIWWHVCGDLDLSPTASLNGVTLASFVIRAGESFGDAARRLCERAGVVLRFRTLATSADGVGWDSVGQSVVSWGVGGSVSSYGPGAGQQPVVQGDVAVMVAPSATSVEVVGTSTSSLARNWDEQNLLGHELIARLVDKTLDSQTKTDSVASAEASLLGPEGRGGEITTLANVGLELGDQVDVTIASAGLNGAVFTVAGLLTSYARAHGLVQTAKLEGTN